MKKILYGLIVILMVVIVSGCGNKEKIQGMYHLIEMKSDGETYNKNLIETLGLNFTLKIDDNTATLTMGNETLELTYDSQKFISKIDEEDVLNYKLDGETITLNYHEEEMVFEKNN